jgi:hypothetical protein
MPGQPVFLNLPMVSLEAKAKPKISENEVCFSMSWYWNLSGGLFPRSPPCPLGSFEGTVPLWCASLWSLDIVESAWKGVLLRNGSGYL